MRRFLMWLMKQLPVRVIFDREGAKPYLTRGYLLGGPRSPEGEDGRLMLWKRRPFNVFLHRFHMSDDADALHNHPCKWSFSIILLGGYVEERRVSKLASGQGCICNIVDIQRSLHHDHHDAKYHVVRRTLKPGSLNVIRDSDYHRVDLLDDECWTLFFAGPKVASWSFWDRATGETTKWWEFIQKRRQGARP